MLTLANSTKTLSFTAALRPDPRVPDVAAAMANVDNVCNKPRQLLGGAFTWTKPEVRKQYQWLCSSRPALRDLGLVETETDNPEFWRVVLGEEVVENPYPYAQAYAGWQFGQFAGQLGDGRVVNLFEIANGGTRYELQLKGAGKTPFSRFADGKAVLRLLVREFVISEALHGVGVPTTRALSLTYLPKTYAQRYGAEKCAVVCRFAPLWVRLGTFDLYRYRRDAEGMRQLCDYVIGEVLQLPSGYESKDIALHRYDQMYLDICRRNGETVGYWMAYGFLNGVLNTDNTSVLGLLMDFGPFAFMDRFDVNYTPNHDDSEGRYGYRNTPDAVQWSLVRLGEDLAEIIGVEEEMLAHPEYLSKGIDPKHADAAVERATAVIELAQKVYHDAWTAKMNLLMAQRLGMDLVPHELVTELHAWMTRASCDYNGAFVKLGETWSSVESDSDKVFAEAVIAPDVDFATRTYSREELVEQIVAWLEQYREALGGVDEATRVATAAKVNPLFVPRNWVLDECIERIQDSNGEDTTALETIMAMATNPYDRSKWVGDKVDPELVARWSSEGDVSKVMAQCSCSS